MNIWSYLLLFVALATYSVAKECANRRSTTTKLFCYYSKVTEIDSCYCSHAILPANSDLKAIERLREAVKGVKILITVNEFNEGLVNILKASKVDGLEVKLNKIDSKNDIPDFISTVKDKLGSDLYIALSVPGRADLLAKYYDFKVLSKKTDAFILQTAFLGANKNVTFHPSRLSGMWDMQNTDSMVDLVSGLGAPLSKIVIASPIQAFQFKLQNKEHTAPGSPATEIKSITRDELCQAMKNGRNWTLERDQDQAGPYIFSEDQWIVFDDSMSIDIKAKYSRVRGLAGLALKDVSQDGGTKCGGLLVEAAYNGLSKQARMPRGAVLQTLEREILETPARPLDNIHVSPYRISRIIDVEGHVHVIRQDTRTEFSCTRQGYFVHPRSCNRFYRCVKFDQRSDEFSVFEFDCPAGLAFDERVEVCVWPGSLPHASACSGSSEIAPVPRSRFVCPSEPGYYADPENCRWFFACLDHGEDYLSAYEFRCPFGLVFDQGRLICEWPWIVPRCGSGAYLGINLPSQVVYGGHASPTYILEQYDGLGSLGAISLGGLQGPLVQPVAKVYSTVGTGHVVQEGSQFGFGQGNLGLAHTGLAHGGGGLSYDSNAIGGSNFRTIGTGKIVLANTGNIDSVDYHGTGSFGVGGGNYLVGGANSGYASSNSASGIGQATIHQGANVGSDVYYNQGAIGQGTSYLDGGNTGSNGFASANSFATGESIVGSKNGFVAQGNNNRGADIRQNVVYAADNAGSLHQGNVGSYNTVQTFGGKLSYNAAKALENAGLYKTGASGSVVYSTGDDTRYNQYLNNIGGSYGLKLATGSGDQNAQTFVTHSGITPTYSTSGISGASFGQYDTSNAANAFGVKTDFSQGSGIVSGVTSNVISSQNINQIHGTSQPVLTGTVNQVSSNIGGNYGIKTGFDQGSVLVSGSNTGGHVESSSGFLGTNNYPYSGSISTQSFNQIHQNAQPVVNTYVNTGGHTAGTIDIVGKGYSAVGDSGVQVTNNGAHILAVTPSPVTVTTVSSVPTVTSVPVPVTGTSSTFGVFHGGVIANAPELQFKVTPNVIYNTEFGARTNYDYANASQVHYASSTPSTVSSSGGYVYEKPVIQFREEPVKPIAVVTPRPVIYQPTVSTVREDFAGYNYPKPSISFEEVPARSIRPITYSTVKPTVVEQKYTPVTFVTPKVTIQPVTQSPVAISSYSFQKEDNFGGYHYEKPAIAFEEVPQVHNVKTSFIKTSYDIPSVTVKPLIYEQPRIISSTPAPFTPRLQQPASFSTSFSQSSFKSTGNQGYVYEKPSVTFEEEPIQLSKTYLPQTRIVEVPSYSYQKSVEIQKSVAPTIVPVVQQTPVVQTYYQRPKTVVYQSQPILPLVQQKPYMFSSYSYQTPVQPTQTYYQSPAPVAVEKERGFFYNYQAPVQKTFVQPAIQRFISHKPMVQLAQKYPAVFSSYTYQQPAQGTYYQQPIQKTVVRPAVSSYNYQNVLQSAVANQGYTYPKPAIQFEEQPIISTTVRPFVSVQPQVVQTYNYVTPTVKPVIVEQPKPVVQTYNYVTPTVKPIVHVQPQIVESYNYVTPTVKPPIVEYQRPVVVSTTQTPIVVEKQTNFVGYDYPKPAVAFNEEPAVITTYENRQPVQEVPFIKKKAYVTGKSNFQANQGFGQKINSWYRLERPQAIARPVVVQNYQTPVQGYVSSTTPRYETFKVDAVNTNSQSSNYYFNQNDQNLFEQNVVYTTPKPTVFYDATPKVSFVTPKPNYYSTIASVVNSKLEPEGKQFYFYDSRVQSTPKAVVQTYSTPVPSVEAVTTSRPIVRYSFSSLDDKYQYTTPTPLVVSHTTEYATPIQVTTPIRTYIPQRRIKVTSPVTYTQDYIEVNTPKSTYLPVQSSTYLPPVKSTYLPPVKSTYLPPVTSTYLPPIVKTQKVVEEYIVPEVKYEPTREYLPVTPPPREYLPAPKPTYLPAKEEFVVTTYAPVIKTQKIVENYVAPALKFEPTREYLPVTPPTREYLPAVTPTREYLPAKEYLPVAPTREYLPVKIQQPGKTIVKVNDFHPLLSAKLGAQCTCTSNTLRLNKRPKQTYIETDDNDAVQIDTIENLEQEVNYEQSGPTVVENYQYEPQKVIDITPTPIIVKDQVYPVDGDSRVYKVRQRVKVRPVSSTINAVTDAYEIFTKNRSPAVEIIDDDDDKPSDREIAKAVRTGLKLVKQAAKEGAKEGTQEVLEGHGGARARLRAEIDCQRPGLFRHPNQCNKFYSCRWDCTKNKYTLHVFNCPVHLTFDSSLGACNWPSQGPACLENTLLPSD